MNDINAIYGTRLGGPTGNSFVYQNGDDTGYRLAFTANKIVDRSGHETGFFVGGNTSLEILHSDGKSTGLALGGPTGRQVIRI